MQNSIGRMFTAPLVAGALCSALGLMAPNASASVIIIDDFTDANAAWPLIALAPGSVGHLETGLTGVLGGSRLTTLTLQSAVTPGLDFVVANIATGPGQFDYASNSGAVGHLLLQYDANGAGLGAFFADKPGIEIGFAFFDHANDAALPVTISLFDGASTATLTLSLTAPGAQTLFFNFNDFDNIGGFGLAYVQSVQVEFDAGAAADFRLTHITVIPAPGALALLGLAGLIGARRRRSLRA